MLKLEQISKSKLLAFIFFVLGISNIFGQTNNTQILQSKSSYSNAQIGTGNINKADNRKYYNTENNTQNENNSYSGPLITGNNPFILINNIQPNRDSIIYELEKKRKNIRIELARHLKQGKILENRCFSEKDTAYNELINLSNQWASLVFNYLLFNLDEGYAIQFDLASNNDSLIFGLASKGELTHNFLRAKTRKIDEFISSLY